MVYTSSYLTQENLAHGEKFHHGIELLGTRKKEI